MPRRPSRRNELLERSLLVEKAIRARVKEILEEKGISHREMDRRLGYAEGLVSRLLGGSRPLEVHELVAISEVLGVDARAFFPEGPRLEDEEPPRSPFPIPEDQWTALIESTLRKLGYGRDDVKPRADENEPAYKPSR